MVSHPAWVCGLKLMNQVGVHAVIASHPAWVCGLKLVSIRSLRGPNESHTLRGCVD